MTNLTHSVEILSSLIRDQSYVEYQLHQKKASMIQPLSVFINRDHDIIPWKTHDYVHRHETKVDIAQKGTPRIVSISTQNEQT